MSLSIACGSHSTMGSSANGTLPAFSERQSTLPATPRPSKCSTSKKEMKRKASSQKPPVITPSDVSEDDKEPCKTHGGAVANSISHRPKRIASNPCSQPHGLPGFKNQMEKKSSTHKPKTNKQHRKDIVIPEPQSALTSFRSDDFISLPNIPSIKGRRSAGFTHDGRKDSGTMILKLPTQLTRESSNSRRLRKTKPVRSLQTRATKRLRRVSSSILDSEPGDGSKSTYNLRAKDLQEPAIQGPSVTSPPLTQENIQVESMARRKRTRLEFETGSVVSHEKATADSAEVLGPDIRQLRPLPQKICDRRLVPVADEDATVCGVPCGAPSLKYVDQLLQDAASNALAVLREGVGPDVPDWTQDDGHDAEYDDFGGPDQDEANDVQETTETPVSSLVTSKPPVPAPPHIWAQVDCFIASSV